MNKMQKLQKNKNKKQRFSLNIKKTFRNNAIKATLMFFVVIVSIIVQCSQIAIIPTVAAAEQETVFVDSSSVIATNPLSLGFQLDGRDISAFATSDGGMRLWAGNAANMVDDRSDHASNLRLMEPKPSKVYLYGAKLQQDDYSLAGFARICK